jgi:hypothetical protein
MPRDLLLFLGICALWAVPTVLLVIWAAVDGGRPLGGDQ